MLDASDVLIWLASEMQNLIVLCHRCFTWGETHSDLCPECGADVCLELPDLDRDRMAEILGRPLVVIGPLQVDRQGLPNYGYLIGTTEGVLFLPRLHRRTNGAWEGMTSQRLPSWWPFRGDHSSPRFLNWLQRPFGGAAHSEMISKKFSVQEIDSLVDRLMDSPGAFFVGLRDIHSITARWQRVKLDRMPARSITFIDETEDRSLLTSLNGHLVQAAKEQRKPPL